MIVPARTPAFDFVQDASGRRLRILVVDDDPSVRMLLAAYLRQHEVQTAENGVLGLEQFRSAAWDAVITDGHLGDMSGLDLAAAIKDTHPLTPVILITGSDPALFETTGGRSPFDAMLTKPCGRLALTAAIEKFCG